MSSSTLLSSLTPEQTQLLYDQAGFLLLSNLPQGSQVGLNGVVNQTSTPLFAGYKLLPPNSLHILTFSPPSSHSSQPQPGTTLPLPRTALLYFSQPKPNHVLLRSYSPDSEVLSAPLPSSFEATVVVSSDHLKTLDPKLAPFPFDSWEAWRALFPPSLVTPASLENVFGEPKGGGWDLDGLEIGEAEELSAEGGGLGGLEAETLGGERVLRHRKEAKDAEGEARIVEELIVGGSEGVVVKKVGGWVQFDVRKSWRKGAEGEEVSLFARDKSWLFWWVVMEQLGGDPFPLLTQLSLLLPLSLLLQAPALLLQTYRRILSLLTLSHLHFQPPTLALLPPNSNPSLLPKFYLSFLDLLTAQLTWLESDFFSSELPEAEGWFEKGLNDLMVGLASVETAGGEWEGLEAKWEELRELVGGKFGWVVGELRGEKEAEGQADEDEEDEEDRPVVVDLGYEVEFV